jgi:hypothetical protein
MMNFFNRGQNQSNSLLRQHAQMVERILQEIGYNPQDVRMDTEDGYGWGFQRGSAIIEVYLKQEEGRDYFQILSPLLHVPPGNLLPLYRRLLELNFSLTNASLGIHLDIVYVFNERPVEGLDESEANFLITQISRYADELDDRLINEFGGRRYGQV